MTPTLKRRFAVYGGDMASGRSAFCEAYVDETDWQAFGAKGQGVIAARVLPDMVCRVQEEMLRDGHPLGADSFWRGFSAPVIA